VTGRTNIIIAISAIVVFAAIVGFFITLDVSPQIAYARLFIDAGLVIGLIAVIMAFYKEKTFSTDSLVLALRSIKNGQYKTRVTNDNGPLHDIAQGINDLATVLEENQTKQEEIKRSLREELLPSLKQKEGGLPEHSFHPELGPVRTLLPKMDRPLKDISYSRDISPIPIATKPPTLSETKLNNTLIASNPPKLGQQKDIGLDPDYQEQNLNELYEKFISAQKSSNIEQIEYSLFLKTLERTKEELKSSYKCHDILFDVVKESDQVALQPKIVREPPRV
jgi:hypothetical protein